MKRVLLISAVITVTVCTALPASAAACSCVQSKPREQLEKGEPAFTGRVLSRRKNDDTPQVHGDESFTYLFRVGHSYNRPHRRRLRLTVGTQSAACGVVFRKGDRVGAFVYRSGGKLTTSLCGIVDPDALIRAGRQVGSQTRAGSGGSCPSMS